MTLLTLVAGPAIVFDTMKRTLSLALISGLVLSQSPGLMAQGQVGTLTGTVTGPAGPLQGATVNVLNSAAQTIGTATTNAAGGFSVTVATGQATVNVVGGTGAVLGTATTSVAAGTAASVSVSVSAATLATAASAAAAGAAAAGAAAGAAAAAAAASGIAAAAVFTVAGTVGAVAATGNVVGNIAAKADPSPSR